jgi:hypothetical protein
MSLRDIQMVKGDTNVFDVYVTRYNPTTGLDEVVPLTDAKAWFSAKRESRDLDADAVISLNSVDDGAQVAITASAGVVRITLVPGDTGTLPEKWYQYDVQLKESPTNVVTTIQRGRLELLKQATISTA